jgi:hypothetical protein
LEEEEEKEEEASIKMSCNTMNLEENSCFIAD